MQPLAINAQHAVAIHDTLGFDIQEMQEHVLNQVVEATGKPIVTGGQSLVVPKAEHDRVLEQLKRYSGE